MGSVAMSVSGFLPVSTAKVSFPIAIRIDESEVIAFRESAEKIRENTRTVLKNLEE